MIKTPEELAERLVRRAEAVLIHVQEGRGSTAEDLLVRLENSAEDLQLILRRSS